MFRYKALVVPSTSGKAYRDWRGSGWPTENDNTLCMENLIIKKEHRFPATLSLRKVSEYNKGRKKGGTIIVLKEVQVIVREQPKKCLAFNSRDINSPLNHPVNESI